MLFMNRWEVEDSVQRHAGDPVLGPASLTLRNLMEWTDNNSDGWAYWPKPCRAAKTLQLLLQDCRHRDGWSYDDEATLVAYRKALRPIRAFRTRQGADFEIVEA
jgi:hypothetical protein